MELHKVESQNNATNPAADKLELQKRAGEKLTQNLEDLVKIYRSLLDLLRKEKEFLLKSDIDALNESNQTKDKLLLKMRSLDALRVNYAVELSKLVGADDKQPRLLDIARRTDAVLSERLRSLHSSLEMLLQRVSELNKENSEYCESALTMVDGAMKSIKEAVTGKKNYGPKGKIQSHNSQANGSFVSKSR